MPVIIDGTLGVNAAAITTTNWTPTNIATGGNTTLGDASADTVTINAGTTTIASAGARIKADFSNSTLSNRVAFQSSVTNGNTAIIALPNGNNNVSSFRAMSSSDADNSAQATLRIEGTEVQLRADTSGTASYLPISFYTSGSQRMTINTGGMVGVGVGNPGTQLDVATITSTGAGVRIRQESGNAGNAILQFTNYEVSAQKGAIHATPTGDLKLLTQNVTALTALIDGNIGIGTQTPAKKLTVVGTALFTNNVNGIYIGNGGQDIAFNRDVDTGTLINSSAFAYQWHHTPSTSASTANLSLQVYNTAGTSVTASAISINGAGNVGIGTATPNIKLDVAGAVQAVHSLSGAFAYRAVADSTNAKAAIQFTNNAANADWAYLEAKSASHTTWRVSAGDGVNTGNATFGINGGPVGIRDIVTTGNTEASDWPVPSLSIASYDDYSANTMLAFMLKDDVNYMTDLSKWNFRLYHGAGQTTSDASTALGLGGPGNLYLQANGAGGIQLTTNGIERMRVQKTGAVSFLNAINGIAVVPDYTNVDSWNWVKLGRITGAQSSGGAMKITIVGAMGYNADPVQSGEDVIYIRGSNGNSAGGRNVGGTYFRQGSGSGNRVVSQVKAKSVNGVSYDNEYDVYALIHSGLSRYCSYRVEHSPDWSWTWSVTNAGSTDPGAESSTVAVFKNSWGVTAYDGTYFNGIAAAPSYAFVHFAGAGTIRNSLGVTSVTRINAGSYRVNFNFTWSDTNYIGVTGLQRVGASGDFINIGFDRTTTYDRVEFFSGSVTTDPTVLSVAYFRNNP